MSTRFVGASLSIHARAPASVSDSVLGNHRRQVLALGVSDPQFGVEPLRRRVGAEHRIARAVAELEVRDRPQRREFALALVVGVLAVEGRREGGEGVVGGRVPRRGVLEVDPERRLDALADLAVVGRDVGDVAVVVGALEVALEDRGDELDLRFGPLARHDAVVVLGRIGRLEFVRDDADRRGHRDDVPPVADRAGELLVALGVAVGLPRRAGQKHQRRVEAAAIPRRHPLGEALDLGAPEGVVRRRQQFVAPERRRPLLEVAVLLVETPERRRQPRLVAGLSLDVVAEAALVDPAPDAGEFGRERVGVVLGAVRPVEGVDTAPAGRAGTR